MSRAWLLQALTRFTTMAGECGLSFVDGDGGLEPAINEALLMVGADPGTLDTPTLTSSQWADARALVRYHGLKLLADQLATRYDIGTDDARLRKDQQFKQVYQLMQDAQKDVTARGYGPDAFTMGRLNLDFLEPSAAEMG